MCRLNVNIHWRQLTGITAENIANLTLVNANTAYKFVLTTHESKF
jgi:hypothetical protein